MMTCELSDAEWDSLKELRSGPLKRKIPLPHQIKLVELGLAKMLFNSIAVTAEGRRYQRASAARLTEISITRVDKPPRLLQLVISNKGFSPPTSS